MYSARQPDHRQALLVSLLKNVPAGSLKHHRLMFKLESCRPQLCVSESLLECELEWLTGI